MHPTRAASTVLFTRALCWGHFFREAETLVPSPLGLFSWCLHWSLSQSLPPQHPLSHKSQFGMWNSFHPKANQLPIWNFPKKPMNTCSPGAKMSKA
jgi:hypothetical protein